MRSIIAMGPRILQPLLVAMVVGVFVMVALASPQASAAERNMVLQLELTGHDSAPTHVCVVTTVKGRIEQSPSIPIEDLDNICGAKGCRKTDVDPAKHEFYLGLRTPPRKEEDERTKKIWESLGGLLEENNEHTCDYGGISCKPFFSLQGFDNPEKSHITCVRNATAGDEEAAHNSRALVLGLTAQHKGIHGPYLRDLRLEGRQLLLTLTKVNNIGHLVRVLGGFYAPTGEAHFSSRTSERSLEIEARCQWTTIGVPPIAAREKECKPNDETCDKADSLDLKIILEAGARDRAKNKGDEKVEGCWSGSFQNENIRLLLPYEPRGRKVLKISPYDDKWKLEANWYGSRPTLERGGAARRNRLNMSVTKLSFSWRSDPCLNPKGQCPKAKISTSDVGCTPTPSEIDEEFCNYTCNEKPGRGQLDFPTTIAFSLSDPVTVYQNWSVDIHTVDQTIEGFVDPSERAFPIRFDTRAPPPQNSTEEIQEIFCNDKVLAYDDIHAVDLMTPDGLTRRIELMSILGCVDKRKGDQKTSVVVKLPNVSCREPIGYRYIGERDYRERLAEVKDGKIQLEHPMESARVLYIAVAAYPASVRTVLPDDLRSEALNWAPMLEASAVIKPRKHGARGWRFNVDGTMIGTRQPFLGIAAEPNAYDSVPEHRNYIRLLLGGSALTPWFRKRDKAHKNPVGRAFAVGGGFQLGGGAPLQKRDFELLDGISFALAPRLDVRLRLSRHFEASFSPRYIGGSKQVRYSTNFSGQPTKKQAKWMHTFVFPVGLVAIW